MSPEMFSGEYSFPSDIWSIGVILFCIFSRYKKKNCDFKNKFNFNFLKSLVGGSDLKYADDYISLIEKCLKEDPNERITASELLIELKNFETLLK
jgi:serine/threonine protein kinase